MKRILLFLSLILTFFIFQCSSPEFEGKKSPPEKLIPKDRLVLILADMQIAEAYLDDMKKPGNMIKDSSLLYYERIFKKNQVTQLDFEESLMYYKRDLEGLDEIYTKVITRLNELKAKNEELLLQMKVDSIRQDSIAKAQVIQDSLQKIQIIQDSILQLEMKEDSLHLVNDSIFVE